MAIRLPVRVAIHREERIASLVAAAGLIWAAEVVTSAVIPPFVLPVGPLETCGIAILLWLHAKWRRSLKAG